MGLNDTKVSKWKVLMYLADSKYQDVVYSQTKKRVHNCVEKLDQSYTQKPAQSHWETNLVCRNVFFLEVSRITKFLNSKIGRKKSACIIS